MLLVGHDPVLLAPAKGLLQFELLPQFLLQRLHLTIVYLVVIAHQVEHTVQSGETLSEIASAYGVRMNALIEANGLKDPDSIRVGQTLFIPD